MFLEWSHSEALYTKQDLLILDRWRYLNLRKVTSRIVRYSYFAQSDDTTAINDQKLCWKFKSLT